MQIIVLIPAFLIFLYSLYKFVKDDYVFIRRNISLEQTFDIAFTTTWVSLLFARIFYFISHALPDKNIFILFFSPGEGGYSLIGVVVGGMIGLYLVGKHKKILIGRLFDFFTLSFMIALPVGFLGNAILLQKQALVMSLVNALLYFIITIIFLKFLYPKFMNRTMKEGNMSIFFLLMFSLISFLTTIINPTKGIIITFNVPLISHILLLLFSIFLLVKQEKNTLKARKYK